MLVIKRTTSEDDSAKYVLCSCCYCYVYDEGRDDVGQEATPTGSETASKREPDVSVFNFSTVILVKGSEQHTYHAVDGQLVRRCA
jgi:hypothetical protein